MINEAEIALRIDGPVSAELRERVEDILAEVLTRITSPGDFAFDAAEPFAINADLTIRWVQVQENDREPELISGCRASISEEVLVARHVRDRLREQVAALRDLWPEVHRPLSVLLQGGVPRMSDVHRATLRFDRGLFATVASEGTETEPAPVWCPSCGEQCKGTDGGCKACGAWFERSTEAGTAEPEPKASCPNWNPGIDECRADYEFCMEECPLREDITERPVLSDHARERLASDDPPRRKRCGSSGYIKVIPPELQGVHFDPDPTDDIDPEMLELPNSQFATSSSQISSNEPPADSQVCKTCGGKKLISYRCETNDDLCALGSCRECGMGACPDCAGTGRTEAGS